MGDKVLDKHLKLHQTFMWNTQVHTLQLMVEQQHRVVEELKSQLARNNSKKTKTRLEAAVSQLAELEAQVAADLMRSQMTNLSWQASRLRGSSNSPDKSPGDPSSSQWPPSPPPRPEPSSTGPVGLPPPLPSRNSVSSVVDLAAPLPPPRFISLPVGQTKVQTQKVITRMEKCIQPQCS